MNLEKLKKFLEEAIDIELFENNRMIIVLENKKIIINGVNSEIKDFCLEYFGRKFNCNNYCNKKISKENLWKNEEIEYLKENCFSKTLKKLSLELGKSEFQISCMIKKLDLYVRKPWTKSEIDFILENPKMKTIELANRLQRSVNSIKSKKKMIKVYLD